MRRKLLVIATVGILLGLVFAGPASAITLQDDHSQPTVDADSVQFQTNTTTSDANETTAPNETVEASEENETVEADEENESVESNETAGIGPGTYLSGAIGAHKSELEGAVSERAFGLSVAAAASNGSKAGLLVNQTERLETRLQELETSRAELEAAYENGSIENGTYQAQMTALEARISGTERMINQTIDESNRLPSEIRQAHGVNDTRLHLLRTQARNLSGPETAELARTIGGPMTGHPAGERGPPAHAGPQSSMGPPENVTSGDDNRTGPSANTTRGPPTNTTRGPPGNNTTGPSDNETMGPGDERTRGPPANGTMGPSTEQDGNTDTNRATRGR